MSHFLWIEDFPVDAKATVSSLFKDVLGENHKISDDKEQIQRDLRAYGIFIELDFFSGWQFIKNKEKLQTVDYIVLDIDLPANIDYLSGEEEDTLENLLRKWSYLDAESASEQSFVEAKKKLQKTAGYHLYVELILEQGFPKEHIIFCSNHGDELKSIQDAFSTAKLDWPNVYTKADSSAEEWINKQYKSPYSRLRRGVLLACSELKKSIKTHKKIQFNDFVLESKSTHLPPQYFKDYLDSLSYFLPLVEPKGESKKKVYKLLFRNLVHEWDQCVNPPKRKENSELFTFVKIMRICRNWVAHNKRLFHYLSEQEVAFFLLINMRALFTMEDKLYEYEKYLLRLFDNILSRDDLDRKTDKLNLKRHYGITRDLCNPTFKGTEQDNGWFQSVLCELQETDDFFQNKDNKQYNSFFISGLFQLFWFLRAEGKYEYKQQQFTNSMVITKELETCIFELSDFNKKRQ